MTTPANPDDLIAWLRAQLDDDERVARAASPGPWSSVPSGDGDRIMHGPIVSGYHTEGYVGNEDADHIARHDPARQLREVDAKRQRLAVIERDLADDPTDETAQYLLRLDLLPYADRPGYREEWRP